MPARPDPGTPQAAALDWVAALMDRGDLAAAWTGADPTLRLVLAQDWVWNHRHDPADWDEIAAGLAQAPDVELVTFVEPGPTSEHPAGPAFARRFAMRHNACGWVVAGVNGDQMFEPGWPPRISRPA